jgi:pimeloyl-ACP methyl ester carboxylesterase
MKPLGALFGLVLFLHPGFLPAQVSAGRVSVGSHSLYYRLSGSGTPLVVIDVGAGESFASWQGIVTRLTDTTAVLVYDRAGYGESDPGPLPRDCRQAALELKALLDKVGGKSPYLLVGHSLGGLNLQLFAHQFPESVHGLVLLDPPPLGWLAGTSFPALRQLFRRVSGEFLATANAMKDSKVEAERKRAHFFMALHSEHQEMFDHSIRQVSAIRTFGSLPLTVMAAGQPNPQMGADAGEYQKFWIEESRLVASRSTQGRFVFLAESSHMIHRDQPDQVVAEILSLLKRRPGSGN